MNYAWGEWDVSFAIYVFYIGPILAMTLVGGVIVLFVEWRRRKR